MEELCKIAKELKRDRDEISFQRDKYKKMCILLYSAMQNEWVKEMIKKSNIEFKFRTLYTKEEIQFYIMQLESLKTDK